MRRTATATGGCPPAVTAWTRGGQARPARAAAVGAHRADRQKGYPAVRIVDLARLAHVSPPTLYSLYADKEQLFIAAYDDVAAGPPAGSMAAYDQPRTRRAAAACGGARLRRAGRGASRRRCRCSCWERSEPGRSARHAAARLAALRLADSPAKPRSLGDPRSTRDLTIEFILGGIREVTAARLRHGRAARVCRRSREHLASWAACYPGRPAGRSCRPRRRAACQATTARPPRLRARAARRGSPAERAQRPAPPGHRQKPARADRRRDGGDRRREGAGRADDPRDRAPRERLQPDLLRDLRVQARRLPGRAEGRHAPGAARDDRRLSRRTRTTGRAPSPRACARWSTTSSSEPAHAHLSVVDTFAASPETLDIREASLRAFAAYLERGYEPVRVRSPRSPPRPSPAACGRCCTATSPRIASPDCATPPRRSSTWR